MPAASAPACVDLQLALRRTRERLQRHPDDGRLHDQAAVLAYQTGDLDAAIASAQCAARLRPKDPLLHDHLGLFLLRAGRTTEAVAAARRAATLEPGHAAVLMNLGNALLADGEPADAIAVLRKAVALEPRQALGHFNLGNAYAAAGHRTEAIAALERAVACDPRLDPARRNLAVLLRAEGRQSAAITALMPLALRDEPEALRELGILLFDTGQRAAALAPLQRLLTLQPDDTAGHLALARCLHRLERKAEAIPALTAVTRLAPQNADGWHLLGLCTTAIEPALAHFRRALELRPDFADAAVQLARRLVDSGRPEEALVPLDAVLGRQPHDPELHYTRGVALRELDRTTEAREANLSALAVRPDHADAHWNLAWCDLRLGRFAEGWRGYEWRWQSESKEPRRFTGLPEWPAECPTDGHLLVWGEQGIGDEVMFAAFLPALQARGLRLTLACAPRLVPLFTRSFPSIAVVAQDPDRSRPDPAIAADWQIPAGSLPARLWTRAGPPHGGEPFLAADPARVARLRHRYLLDERPLVGLAWSTTNSKNGRARTIAPAVWAAALCSLPARFVSLQYGDTSDDLAVAARAGLEVIADPGIDSFHDLDGFAAQVAAMDAVLTIDNSTVHFAGALGRPTWLLVPSPSDWRWGIDSGTTPWYRSVRLHRRTVTGDWTAPLAAARAELAGPLPSRS